MSGLLCTLKTQEYASLRTGVPRRSDTTLSVTSPSIPLGISYVSKPFTMPCFETGKVNLRVFTI